VFLVSLESSGLGGGARAWFMMLEVAVQKFLNIE
jgi:hypothetical protein